jgi:hypothetical protein
LFRSRSRKDIFFLDGAGEASKRKNFRIFRNIAKEKESEPGHHFACPEPEQRH